MINYIELISNLVQMLILIWFISDYFGYKRSRKKSVLGFIFVWMLTFFEISFINSIIVYDGFLSGFLIITFILYSSLFLKGTFQAHIFLSIFAEAIVFIIGSTTIFIFSYFLGNNIESTISEFSPWRVLMLIMCRTLEWWIFKVILKVNTNYSLTTLEWLLFTLLPLMTWTAVTLMTNASIISQEILPYMFYLSLIMVAINAIIFFFMIKIKQDTETKYEYNMLKMQYSNMKNMENNMKALYESTHSLQHDLGKHFLVIQAMARENKCKDILSYTSTINNDYFGSSQKIIITGNDIFDAVINTKLEFCKQKNIVPNISVDKEAVQFIKKEDIAVLFGNLFDNAIEAAEKSIFKEINFSLQLQGQYVSICLENSYNSDFSDINLKTTKNDKREHGFGVKNIKKIVEENNGDIQYFTNDSGLFCCDIIYKKCI